MENAFFDAFRGNGSNLIFFKACRASPCLKAQKQSALSDSIRLIRVICAKKPTPTKSGVIHAFALAQVAGQCKVDRLKKFFWLAAMMRINAGSHSNRQIGVNAMNPDKLLSFFTARAELVEARTPGALRQVEGEWFNDCRVDNIDFNCGFSVGLIFTFHLSCFTFHGLRP